MNIIIIDHEPFTLNKKDHYFMNEFLLDGIQVDYWSVCEAVPYSKNVTFPNKVKGKNIVYIDSYKELLEKIKKIDPTTLVFLEVWFTWSTLELFQLLKKRNIRFVQIDYYLNLVTAFSSYSRKEKFVNDFSFTNLMKWGINLFNSKCLEFLARKTQLNKKSILFLTGGAIQYFHPQVYKKSISYFDVEAFEKIKSNPRLIAEKYVTFLDILLPAHPDLQRIKVSTLSSACYYEKMRNFFDEIEEKTGYQVVIASHPKANYKNNEFGSRSCIHGKTAELVKDSEFVITHGSLSINFALLAQKPLLYIYSDEFINSKNYLSVLYQRMKNAADFFKAKIINIDSYEKDTLNGLQFDFQSYQAYLNQYVLATAYPKGNYEIIKESLSKLDEGVYE